MPIITSETNRSPSSTLRFLVIKANFYAPGLKGPRGASSNWIVCPSVHPSVCPSVYLSVRNSVPLTNKVQYGWWYSNQTWTVASSMGSSHFTDITCPWRCDGVKMLDLEIFAIFWLCCRRGHPCFTNTCLVLCQHCIGYPLRRCKGQKSRTTRKLVIHTQCVGLGGGYSYVCVTPSPLEHDTDFKLTT